jgi:hypothetical protein
MDIAAVYATLFARILAISDAIRLDHDKRQHLT